MADDETIIHDLTRISKRAFRLGFAVAGEGNTSARSLSGESFWIKRSGCSLGEVTPLDFIQVDISRALREPDRLREAVVRCSDDRYRPSIEVPMHASIFAHSPEANFIVHTHPPCTLAGCCSKDPREFFRPQFPDSVVYLGVAEKHWAFVPYASPGPGVARILNEALSGLSEDLRVVILANHGAITVGKNANEAIGRTEILEKASYVRLMSSLNGCATFLGPDDVMCLENMESERYRQRVLKGEI